MSQVKPSDTVVVWFSCGVASAAAAKLTLDVYGGNATVRIVNNPIANEHDDNRRFLRDVEAWLGVTIETSANSKYPDADCNDVWRKARYMGGIAGAPCTVELKRKARQAWELDNKTDWLVLGFTLEEKPRSDRFTLTERNNVLPILIDHKFDRFKCFDMIHRAGIKPPEIYSLGYPNANCIGCVKASSPTYWNLVRNTFPDVFEERATLSRELGARLVRVNNKRIFLDELCPNEKGQDLKTMHVECGLFCEEQ